MNPSRSPHLSRALLARYALYQCRFIYECRFIFEAGQEIYRAGLGSWVWNSKTAYADALSPSQESTGGQNEPALAERRTAENLPGER